MAKQEGAYRTSGASRDDLMKEAEAAFAQAGAGWGLRRSGRTLYMDTRVGVFT